MKKPSASWIGVDLDGTLAIWEPTDNYDPTIIGNPIQPMVDRVKNWLANGIEVRIFTARVTEDGYRNIELVRSAIQDWCEIHLGQRLKVTNIKDYGLIKLWDDRAVGVIPNTGIPCCSNNH